MVSLFLGNTHHLIAACKLVLSVHSAQRKEGQQEMVYSWVLEIKKGHKCSSWGARAEEATHPII